MTETRLYTLCLSLCANMIMDDPWNNPSNLTQFILRVLVCQDGCKRSATDSKAGAQEAGEEVSRSPEELRKTRNNRRLSNSTLTSTNTHDVCPRKGPFLSEVREPKSRTWMRY